MESGTNFPIVRAVANVLLAVLTLILPFEASMLERTVVAGLIMVNLIVTHAVDRRVGRAGQNRVPNVMIMVIVAVITSIIPVLWMAGVVVLVALAIGTVPVESRLGAMVLVALAAVLLAAVGISRGIDYWYLPIAAFVILAPAVERYHAQWRLERAETDRRYDTLVETAGLFFWELDPATGRLVSITGNTMRTLGRRAEDVVGMHSDELVVDRSRFMDALSAARIEPEGDGVFAVFDLRHESGGSVPFRHRLRVSESTGFIQGVAMEITELALATRLIRHQAEHDDLTGLVTRNVFITQLAERLDQCSEQDPVAVLLVDLNRFKELNDVLGHRIGDQVLSMLARRFEQLDFVDSASRLGGDEFAFLLAGPEAHRAAQRALEIVEAIEELVMIERLTLSVSASVGVAVAPFDGQSSDVVMMRADTAMYRAKDAQERVVQFSESRGARVGEQLALSQELASAIENGQIELWFQPKIDLNTERVVAAEGLARWRHPELGLLTPDRFLPVLSVSGDYQAFTDEVIRQGIHFAAQTDREGAPIDVAVNLSAMSFFDRGLAERVSRMLRDAGVPPRRLTFEITESDILEDLSVHGPVFESLTRLGIDLSIDDFGVGYSSLSRLRKLPVQELKIDRSFVMGMVTDPEDLIIVKAVVDLASVLGHRSVAEGVETAEAWDRLREIGCDLAQGYYMSRPIPGDEFLRTHQPNGGVRRFVHREAAA
ncbi:MAG: bifunctional diguanylate cyclase/phosphodiesterase [Actinomycetota bacterium]